jgi:N-acetylmuramoyl-L-alanine amidase
MAIKICVDPGHGGHDPGAVGPTGLTEASRALIIGELVGSALLGHGVQVKLTRSTDVFIQLHVRCDIANDWEANYFVSIHCNSDGPSAKGIETLYTSPTGKELARPVQKALIGGLKRDRDAGDSG